MNAIAQWKRLWAGMVPREQRMVLFAMAVVVLALLWWVALAPALGVVRTADARHRVLDGELQRMRALQSQAQTLQSLPSQSFDDSLRALEITIRQRLGLTARYSIAGDRVTVTLTGTPADALAQWLSQARVNARALPTETRLTRNAAGLWDGTLVMTLPAR